MTKSRKPLYAVVLIAALAAAAVTISRHMAPKGVQVTTDRAALRTITQTVTATGKLQPEVEVKITAEVYGQIVELPFREGARVKKGELIVKIKPDLYQAQVDQQSAAVAMARGQLVHSQASLVKAESDLKQYEDLHQRGLASDADFMTYKTNRDTARADLSAAEAAVSQAEGLLGQARDSLAKTSIYSPMDGVVSSRSCELGEGVVAQGNFTGSEIMRVADLSHMEAQVNVNENDIPAVKVGDRADLTIDAYADRKFGGTVKEIGSSAATAGAAASGSSGQASGSSSSSGEVTSFLVKIRLDNADVELKPGMSATADIRTRTVANAVAVPIQSVTLRESGAARGGKLESVVFVRNGGSVRLQPVDTGIADNTWIEIKRGLGAGDEVVTGSYSVLTRVLQDGSPVSIQGPGREAGAH